MAEKISVEDIVDLCIRGIDNFKCYNKMRNIDYCSRLKPEEHTSNECAYAGKQIVIDVGARSPRLKEVYECNKKQKK